MRIVVSFSGGKDSQACLIWAAKKYGVSNIEAVFCDTGWEHPLTYEHIESTCNKMGVKLNKLINSKGETFSSISIKMKMFPNSQRRVCTTSLKMKPMLDWILNQEDNLLVIQGIRGKESQSRAKMAKECSYFGEYYDKTKKGLYRKKDVLKWASKYDASILRPLFEWTSQDVIDYILANNQDVNPLYKRGVSRVGCYPCIMARQLEVKILSKDAPMLQRLVQLEKDVNNARDYGKASFFPKVYIPYAFCREYGNGVPSIMDVVNYVTRNDDVLDMFEPEEGYSCMSIYHGLCE